MEGRVEKGVGTEGKELGGEEKWIMRVREGEYLARWVRAGG